MNFSPFSTHFPGISQFVPNSSLGTQDTSNTNNNANRYTNTSSNNTINSINQNKQYANQSISPAQYGTVSYSQSNSETKNNIILTNSNYQQISTNQLGKDNVLQHSDLTQDLTALLQQTDTKRVLQNVNTNWQNLSSPATSVADYLSHLPNTLPLSLHHFLKYSAENIKKETSQNPLTTIDISHTLSHPQVTTSSQINLNNLTSSLLPSTTSIANLIQQQTTITQSSNTIQASSANSHENSNNIQIPSQLIINQVSNTSQTNVVKHQKVQNDQVSIVASGITVKKQKKKKKKLPKEKKTRLKLGVGEIRLTSALDGSTLYECPDCQVCYPERSILEQHMVGHNLERKFICDVCNAGLKRKDHLTRHKQSHNPQRPFICTVCLKGFKRKEQLTLHVVIHSGEKRHVCNECGKGFYRKDHLRKHTRSHIMRRLKAEINQPTEDQSANNNNNQQEQTRAQQNMGQNTLHTNNNNNSTHDEQQQQLNSIQQTLIQQQMIQAQQLQAQMHQQGQLMTNLK
uniref:CSON003197 protein n=1 Tax=Culicoides sonorensis TaxID=179676 RepID=A0A336MQH3_CULSO